MLWLFLYPRVIKRAFNVWAEISPLLRRSKVAEFLLSSCVRDALRDFARIAVAIVFAISVAISVAVVNVGFGSCVLPSTIFEALSAVNVQLRKSAFSDEHTGSLA